MSRTADRFDAFRRLHEQDSPLLLPNAWDFASAAALAGRTRWRSWRPSSRTPASWA